MRYERARMPRRAGTWAGRPCTTPGARVSRTRSASRRSPEHLERPRQTVPSGINDRYQVRPWRNVERHLVIGLGTAYVGAVQVPEQSCGAVAVHYLEHRAPLVA